MIAMFDKRGDRRGLRNFANRFRDFGLFALDLPLRKCPPDLLR